MPNYTGSKCIVCQNLFKESDDIVVCPDCGTPYHRSCYAAHGACVNLSLHETGMSWEEVHGGHSEQLTCPNCSHNNPGGAVYCNVCGTRLSAQPQNPYHQQRPQAEPINLRMPDGTQVQVDPLDPCCGFSPEEELGGERLEDVAAFVGSNTLYYIPLFKRFKDSGRRFSVNLPALLFPHLYFAHRKMWLVTFLVLLLMGVCSVPSLFSSMYLTLTVEENVEMYNEMGIDVLQNFAGLIAFMEEHTILMQRLEIVGTGIQLAVRILLCGFANWLYFRHAVKKVKALRSSEVTPQMRRMLLRAEGGTNFMNMLGAIVLYYSVVIFLTMGFMIPFL